MLTLSHKDRIFLFIDTLIMKVSHSKHETSENQANDVVIKSKAFDK